MKNKTRLMQRFEGSAILQLFFQKLKRCVTQLGLIRPSAL